MLNLAIWAVALVKPIAMRVLVALGLGVVSYAGLDTIINNLGADLSNALTLGGASFQVASLMGFPKAAGIIFGGITTKLSLVTMKRFQIL